MGYGHGWSGASCVYWNVVSDQANNNHWSRARVKVEAPPGAISWSVGSIGLADAGDAGANSASRGRSEWESYGRHVRPASLYLAQKQEASGSSCSASAFTTNGLCAAGTDSSLTLLIVGGTCASTECSQAECCEAAQLCTSSAFSDDSGCAAGAADSSLAAFDASGTCSSALCSQAECCEAAQLCSSSAFSDDSGCAAGADDVLAVFDIGGICSSVTCTQAECCASPTYTYDIQGCVGTARHLYREGDTRQRRPPLSHTHTCATQLQRRALARVTTIGIFSVLL